MAKDVYKQKNVRIISLGTAEKKFEKIDAKSVTVKQLWGKLDEFMMNIDTYTSDAWIKATMTLRHDKPYTEENYVRAQVFCSGNYDDVSYMIAMQSGMTIPPRSSTAPYNFCPMDIITDENIDGLKFLGELMWKQNE